ncbi:hypothetical protein COBT_002814, partial [Conglomerata obtusa]
FNITAYDVYMLVNLHTYTLAQIDKSNNIFTDKIKNGAKITYRLEFFICVFFNCEFEEKDNINKMF